MKGMLFINITTVFLKPDLRFTTEGKRARYFTQAINGYQDEETVICLWIY